MVVGIGAYTANIYNQITVMYDIYLFRLQPWYQVCSKAEAAWPPNCDLSIIYNLDCRICGEIYYNK